MERNLVLGSKEQYFALEVASLVKLMAVNQSLCSVDVITPSYTSTTRFTCSETNLPKSVFVGKGIMVPSKNGFVRITSEEATFFIEDAISSANVAGCITDTSIRRFLREVRNLDKDAVTAVMAYRREFFDTKIKERKNK
jgi:hypothetical protein